MQRHVGGDALRSPSHGQHLLPPPFLYPLVSAFRSRLCAPLRDTPTCPSSRENTNEHTSARSRVLRRPVLPPPPPPLLCPSHALRVDAVLPESWVTACTAMLRDWLNPAALPGPAASTSSAGTVEDAFVGCLIPNITRAVPRPVLLRAVRLWLTQHAVLKSGTPEDFFARPDTFGWSAAPEFLRYWVAIVVQKFNKLMASEYAYSHPPPGVATEWLTFKTALLVKVEHLQNTFQQQLQDLAAVDATLPWRWSEEAPALDIFMALVFVLIFYERPAIAARAVAPVFLGILEQQEDNFTVVPQLLTYFIPHMSFQGIPFAERVAMVAKQLTLRGFQFQVAFTYADAEAAATASGGASRPSTPAAAGAHSPCSTELVPMSVQEVVQRMRDLSSTSKTAALHICSRIERDDGTASEATGLTFNKYLAAVVQECRAYYLRCKQAANKHQRNRETLLRLEPSDVHGVMRRLHKMLRFGSPHYEHFVQMSEWGNILRSDGWVPLSLIESELAAEAKGVVAQLPAQERLEIVETLLRQHDNFQRFQVDCCPLRKSPYYTQRCARSVYAHEIRNPPLYRQIICQPECLVRPDDATALGSLPLFGWVALSERPQRTLGAHPSLYCLFDNIPFFVVMPAEALGAFREYAECTPALKKYDEKLRKPTLWFAEVYLRALARDGAATVVDSGSASNTSSSSIATAGRGAGSLSSLTSTALTASSLLSIHSAATPASLALTEVYTKVQGESNAVTQRWYVFPQYYVKKLPKPAATEAAAEVNVAQARLAAARDTDFVVHRTAVSKAAPMLGLPKLFFTGRVAELRALRRGEVSRHTARDAEDDARSARAPPAEAATRSAAGTVGRAQEEEAAECEGLSRDDAAAAAAAPATADGANDDDDASDDERRAVMTASAVGESPAPSRRRRRRDRRRGTPLEFCPTSDAGDGGGETASSALDKPGAVGDELLARQQAALCEYAIVTYHASAAFLPDVVVRVRAAASGVDEDAISIRLSPLEPEAEYYSRCFPPSRMLALFDDYVAEAMREVVLDSEAGDDEGTREEGRAAAEWQRAARTGGATLRRALGPWGAQVPASPRPQPEAPGQPWGVQTAPQPGAALLNRAGGEVFDKAALLAALVRFIDGKSFSCVLEVRTRTESGIALPGCRQGVMELKAFARERGLQYALITKRSSHSTPAGDETAHASTGGATGEGGEAAYLPPSAHGRSSASPPQPSIAAESPEVVPDIEVYEFRKRVTWTARELGHVLSELQLQPGDIPVATLIEALTRECEDSTSNYELLEFIGDAVMDFLVAADACVLANVARQRASSSSSPGSPVSPAGVRWDPTLYPLPLPRHCWLDPNDAVTSVMDSSVTATVCRNHVLAKLLPPTVSRHFDEEHYPQLILKVRADVFEALLGAAYRSGLGFDRLRTLLRRLFSFLPAAVRAARAAHTDSTDVLFSALRGCPYTVDETVVERLILYRTTTVLEQAPQLLEVPGDAAKPAAAVNTHLASSLLPRIQGKEFATMFTTGVLVYSYRRLFFFDTARLHNRILHLFSERSIGYVNEIITNMTHLVLDLDKVHPRSWGLLSIIWDWYTAHYDCPAAAFALDSSGVSVVNGQWKDSCHVHFPQVTVSIETWASLVEHIRTAVVHHLTAKETRLRNSLLAQTSAYRVWLRPKTLAQLVHAAGGQPRPHLWDYCDAATLLTLRRTSRALRLSVLEHVAFVTQTLPGLAAFAELSTADDLYLGRAKENDDLAVVEYCGADAQTYPHRLVLPTAWVAQCRAAAGKDGAAPALFESAGAWDKLIDPDLFMSKKLRLYLNDKCDTKYGSENRPLVLDTLLVVSVAQHRLCRWSERDSHADRSGGVAGWLAQWPTRGIVEYHPQRHNQPALESSDLACLRRQRLDYARREERHRLRVCQRERGAGEAAASAHPCTAPSAAEWIDPIVWDGDHPCDDPAAGWVVECAHGSTLALSSLRTSEYRGTDQKLYASWVNCVPSTPGQSGAGNAPPAPLFNATGAADTLPSFSDVYEHRVTLPGQLECGSWTTWTNGCILRSRNTPASGVARTNAWSPAWWAFDPWQATATLFVATEPLLRLTNTDSLATALLPLSVAGGRGGMERFAQLFMPQVSYANVPAVKLRPESFGSHFFPLFPDTSVRKMEAPTPTTPAPLPARQPPTAAASSKTPVVKTASAPLERHVMSLTAGVAEVQAALRSAPAPAAFARLPRIVSLAPHVPDAVGPVWLARAVAYVFTATAARTELASLPVALCESNAVQAQLRAAVGCDTEPRRRLRTVPFTLSLQDFDEVRHWVKALGGSWPATLHRLFLVTSADLASAAAAPGDSLAVHVVGRRFRALWDTVLTATTSARDSAQVIVYVGSDALREALRGALTPTGRVLS
uniref:Dicer 1 n=1 Tax=Zelonia costaricensis TaxID=372075 RepID=A0A1B2LUM8_9TRYP|nr:dicer 1 [Zelonia costaricensis]